jgi:hypothetical protein
MIKSTNPTKEEEMGIDALHFRDGSEDDQDGNKDEDEKGLEIVGFPE